MARFLTAALCSLAASCSLSVDVVAGTWTAPETIGEANPFAEPQFATNARGDVLLAWPNENHVELAFAPLGGSFEAPETVPGPARACSHAPPVSVDLDDKGRAVVAWEHFAFTTFEEGCRIIVRASVRDSSGNFTPSQRLSSNAWDAYDPEVSIAGGRAAVTYTENCCIAFVATARGMRGFGDRRRVSSWAFDPFVDMDPTGAPTFSYATFGRRGAGIWERRQSARGELGAPTKLSREYAGWGLDVRYGAAQAQAFVWNPAEPDLLKAAIRVGRSPLTVRQLARAPDDAEFDFTTAATRTRQFAVAFTTDEHGSPPRARLSRRFPGQNAFSRPRAMPEAIATERAPALAVGRRGKLLVGWLDVAGEEVRGTLANRAGDFRDYASFPLADPICEGQTDRFGCERPAAFITPQGHGYLAWVDGGTVRVSRHLPAN